MCILFGKNQRSSLIYVLLLTLKLYMMKHAKNTKLTLKKLSLNKHVITQFHAVKGGSEFNTLLPSHQSLNQYSCPQDL